MDSDRNILLKVGSDLDFYLRVYFFGITILNPSNLCQIFTVLGFSTINHPAIGVLPFMETLSDL